MSAPANLDAIATRALDFVAAGQIVGLGTGRAATAFIHILGVRVRMGLKVTGVATSEASAELAQRLHIPLAGLDDVAAIDVTVDGADEVDPQCNVIKGYGGAHVREKIIALASKKLIILVGDEKLVPVLGSRGKLPVEVLPFGAGTTARRLAAMGFPSEVRQVGGKPLITDNGNLVLDCSIGPLENPAQVDADLRAIPGVVGTGLFVNMVDVVLVQRGEQVEVLTSQRKS